MTGKLLMDGSNGGSVTGTLMGYDRKTDGLCCQVD